MKRATMIAAIALIAAVALVIARDGDKEPDLRVTFANAAGLREGSTVRVGGVEVGRISRLHLLGADDEVVADLELEPEMRPVGRDARAAIRASNLLGEKYIELTRGDPATPLPAGATLPSRRTSVQPDLDQLLDVLDPGTRGRLRVLINEAGVAMLGRGADLNALLARLPSALDGIERAIAQVSADDRALARAIDEGDRFIGRVAAERRELGRLTSTSAAALRAVAARHASLGDSVAEAPSTLAALRRWLRELRRVAADLPGAARAIRTAAPRLGDALEALPPFVDAALPALAEARVTSPELARLGREGAPVLRRAAAPVKTLAAVAPEARPLSETVDRSIDDLLGLAEGWARATQMRDGVGHTFRGTALVSAEALKHAMSRYGQLLNPPRRRRGTGRAPATTRPVTPRPAAPAPRLPSAPTERLPKALGDVVRGVGDLLPLTQRPTGPRPSGDADGLLDFLLGRP